MDDNRIIDLFWARDPSAISESDQKYGKYCHTIAYRILFSHEDSEECVNDTWHNAWRAIPPERPGNLPAFFGCITRNLALDRYGYRTAKKRNAHMETLLDEYWQCIPDREISVEDETVLKDLINGFLGSLDRKTRIIFLRRYWYACRAGEIARSMGMSENHIHVILHRTRNKFKRYLQKEGVSV